ncbi:SAM-dependent methyltransferase [Rheinheimera riviphila]|uniref:SAM-dependent methyltransferase n=1 Tax=Rheinheimera riviphila TaxID=1834037 RepID=A0A437QM70_9GAMM|nr:SAM-dependent methyltransferase [Rheinheimera riviphila]RVU35597.1 SAM-dependent methyltransferase [Rheinheimera riviphila]
MTAAIPTSQTDVQSNVQSNVQTDVQINTEADPKLLQFLQLLTDAFQNGQLVRLVLSKYQGDDPELQRLVIRPVLLKNELQLLFLSQNRTFDQTHNYLFPEALSLLKQQLGQQFFSAHLQTSSHELQLSFSKKGKVLLSKHPVKTAVATVETSVDLTHNKAKQRYVEQSRPYLQALGITDAKGDIIPAMSKKWKQINKFIEVLAKAIQQTGLMQPQSQSQSQSQQLHVADFGSGKAYLTFAVFDYLTSTLGLSAKVTGVELRQPLVDLCNEAATRLQLSGLQFEQGDVKHFKTRGINVMIALHACDIATDYAIDMGIRTGAEIIMCSPCCHKELRPQLQSPAVLSPLLIHGIHLGQEAEMLTDGLRALLLEAHGYDTQVFEFISLEHTSKNKMILAQKRKKAGDNSAVLQQIAALKAFYGIKQHTLETLLANSEQ